MRIYRPVVFYLNGSARFPKSFSKTFLFFPIFKPVTSTVTIRVAGVLFVDLCATRQARGEEGKTISWSNRIRKCKMYSDNFKTSVSESI